MTTDTLSLRYLHDVLREPSNYDSTYPIWIANKVRKYRYYKGEPSWWRSAEPRMQIRIYDK